MPNQTIETPHLLLRALSGGGEHSFGLWSAVLKSSGEMIGDAGIVPSDIEGSLVPEIAYHFNPDYWQDDYASEAVAACKEYAFNQLGFKEVFAVVRSTNIPAKNVAIRSGMLLRQRIVRPFCGEETPHFVLSAKNPPELLKMDDFFTAQAPAYDEYMLDNVEGFAEGCAQLAKHVPEGAKTLLDLGCGTGLELAEIFKLYPDMQVTGMDITQAMLDKLAEKYHDRQINLICASYLDCDFGHKKYDCVVSLETMHHWTHEEKRALYANILKALKPGGRYIEGDYMAESQAAEDRLLAERKKLREAQNIPAGAFYHFDIPCTVENQTKLLLHSGFTRVDKVWHKGKTAILVCQKQK